MGRLVPGVPRREEVPEKHLFIQTLVTSVRSCIYCIHLSHRGIGFMVEAVLTDLHVTVLPRKLELTISSVHVLIGTCGRWGPCS